jgi:hypothetical protein
MQMRGAAALAGIALITTMAGTAHAAPPVQHERGTQTWSDVFDGCGFEIRVDAVEGGHLLVRQVRGSDGAAYLAHENYRDRYVLTNTATGQWFETRGSGLFKELRGRQREDLGETIWEFTAMDVGRTFTVLDSSGRTVLRNRGRVSLRVLFDVGADRAPGGELLSIQALGASGKHPAGLDPLEGFCDIATDLIGPGRS